MDITQIIPAPASQERLPEMCGCCNCVKRYCICSCCCAAKAAAGLAALSDGELMEEAVRRLRARDREAFRAAYAEMDARTVRRVLAAVRAGA